MNTKMNKKSGFTLLEIIIVIIIVGVLASLALPRFFSTVEFSRSTEALSAMASVRQALERCYLQQSGTYANCNIGNLDVQNPSTAAGAHFKAYAVTNQGAAAYTITATRGTINGGDGASIITVVQDSNGVTRSGTGVFSGIK